MSAKRNLFKEPSVKGVMSTIVNLFQHKQQGFEGLLAPHIEQLYRLAYRFTGDRHNAEDLVQELLVKLYPKRHELEGIEALRPWLMRSLYHLFIDTTRKDKRSPSLADVDDEVLDTLPGHELGPEQRLGNEQLQQQLKSALDRLNPDQRVLLSLHDIEGYTLPELEELLDTPLGTLKSRLHRARAQMRKHLKAAPPAPHQPVIGMRNSR